MPKLLAKQKVLNGRGEVVTWSDSNVGKFFYREKVKGRKTYRNKLIPNAKTMEEAVSMCMDIAIQLREEDPHHLSKDAIPKEQVPDESLSLVEREEKLIKRKERLAREERKKEQPKMTVEKALNDWLAGQKKRVDAGRFAEASYSHKYYSCLHIKSYLEHKKIFFSSQISTDTFDDYIEFRYQDTQKRLVIQRELAVLGEWIKSYLVRFKYIPAHLWLDGQFLPRIEIRQIDRDANPAINADDWKVILDYVRDVWRKEAYEPTPITTSNQFHKNIQTTRKPEKKVVWFRNMFWTWIRVAKNTGMSPEEVCKLKWKNIEIRDVGRYNSRKAEEEVYAIQREGIDVIQDSPEPEDGDWVPEHMIGREERLISYISTIRKKTSAPREIPCDLAYLFQRWMNFLQELNVGVNPDDFVFAQIYNEKKEPSQARIRQTWRKIVDQLMSEGKLKGHKFSDRKYTLYSMRSTFIEDHLLRRTDLYLLARVSGHSVTTLMESYERLDIRQRAQELTTIEHRKGKAPESQVINLFDS